MLTDEQLAQMTDEDHAELARLHHVWEARAAEKAAREADPVDHGDDGREDGGDDTRQAG